MTLTPAELNVDQTTQLVSDQWEVALNGSGAFVGRASLGLATIQTGLLDPYLAEDLVTNMAAGIVDEVELHVVDDKQTSVVRGRNQAAYAVDSSVFVIYAVGGATGKYDQTQAIPGFSALPIIEGVTVPAVVGTKRTASQIAADLCSRAGVGLSWGAPDYVMREDFTVNGSVSSAIQQLVAPFSQFEPSAADLWEENGTLIVRMRSNPGAGMELDAYDTRITDLIIRARGLGFIRVLRLIGSKTGSSTTGFAVDPGSAESTTVDEIEENGTVVSRIVTTEVVRALDHAVTHQTIDTYEDLFDGNGLTLISTDETTSDWDDLELAFPNQIINSPKENSHIVIKSALDPDTGTFGPQRRTSIGHAYDANGYLSAQNTREEEWDPQAENGAGVGDWVLSSEETKQYRDNGLNMYQIKTTQIGADGSPGQVRRTTANGTRPGGPGRAIGGGSSGGGQVPEVFATLISQAPGARDVTITNNNLLQEHLQIIAGQAAQANGATEIEISFTAAGFPWLRRGQAIHLTGLEDEFGYEIDIAPATVSEVRTEYRESGDGPTYLSYVKALYWE